MGIRDDREMRESDNEEHIREYATRGGGLAVAWALLRLAESVDRHADTIAAVAGHHINASRERAAREGN